MCTILKTTSHRSRERVKYVLGRMPPFYYSWRIKGSFIKLDDLVEIAKVLAAKGVSKARNQNEDDYHLCWSGEAKTAALLHTMENLLHSVLAESETSHTTPAQDKIHEEARAAIANYRRLNGLT